MFGFDRGAVPVAHGTSVRDNGTLLAYSKRGVIAVRRIHKLIETPRCGQIMTPLRLEGFLVAIPVLDLGSNHETASLGVPAHEKRVYVGASGCFSVPSFSDSGKAINIHCDGNGWTE